jgi:hypothetical protein
MINLLKKLKEEFRNKKYFKDFCQDKAKRILPYKKWFEEYYETIETKKHQELEKNRQEKIKEIDQWATDALSSVGYRCEEKGIDFREAIPKVVLSPVLSTLKPIVHFINPKNKMAKAAIDLPVVWLLALPWGISKGIGHLIGNRKKKVEKNRELAEPILKERDEKLKVLSEWASNATRMIWDERKKDYQEALDQLIQDKKEELLDEYVGYMVYKSNLIKNYLSAQD